MRPASTNLRADIFHGPDPLELQQAGGGGVEGRPPGPDLSPVTVLLDTGDIYSKKKSSQICQKLKQQIQVLVLRGRDRSPREPIIAPSLPSHHVKFSYFLSPVSHISTHIYHIKMADCGGFGSIDFLVKATGLSDPGLRLVIGLFSGTLLLCYNLVIFFIKVKG